MAGQPAIKRVNLALQGGGAHGAFTWGVLDRLLQEPTLEIDGVSATSAGAMNAVALASGLASGGREGGRRTLRALWQAVGRSARHSPLQPSPFERFFGSAHKDWSPSFMAFDSLTRIFSPYQLNPMNYNPLREVLVETIDFAALRAPEAPLQLFLCATNVRSGKIRIFETGEITADTVLASSCLPFLFQAVEIEGEAYWDGGYMGNPAIFPLIYHCESPDVVIVHINPLQRPEVPTTAAEIYNRINEISFNSSLMREMRAIEFVSRLIDEDRIADDTMKRMRIHAIQDSSAMAELSVNSKLNADMAFLEELHALGRARTEQWLADCYGKVGQDSSVDLRAAYL
ncbi:MAG: patatin-like phospholipase family protein [Rhodospirillales bacterium]